MRTSFTGLNSHLKTYIHKTHKTLIPPWSDTQEKFPRRLVTLMWNCHKEGLTVVAAKILGSKDNCSRLSLQHTRTTHKVSHEGHERLQMFQSFERDIKIEKQKKGRLVSACKPEGAWPACMGCIQHPWVPLEVLQTAWTSWFWDNSAVFGGGRLKKALRALTQDTLWRS